MFTVLYNDWSIISFYTEPIYSKSINIKVLYSIQIGNCNTFTIMRRIHSADYDSPLRSVSDKTWKAKKSDYYPQWSGMSYHCLNIVVYVRNKFLRIVNDVERSTRHPDNKTCLMTSVKTCNHDSVVTFSAVSDQNCNKDQCFLSGVLWNMHNLDTFFITGFSPDRVQIATRFWMPNANHLAETVWEQARY